MSRPSLDEQGCAFDVPAREWNWGFIGLLAGSWALVIVLALCIGFLGWKFVAGIVWCGAVAALLYWFAFGDIK